MQTENQVLLSDRQSKHAVSKSDAANSKSKKRYRCVPVQDCLRCGYRMGAMPGSRDAICQNCGYKDPCCE